MRFRGLEKASKNFKRIVYNFIKIVAIVLADGVGGSEKSSDFGGDTFEHSEESIFTDQRPESEDQWETPLEMENFINEARVLCKMITDEVQWQKMKKELMSSHNYSRLGILETIRRHLLIRYFSPSNSKANPAIPKPQSTENIACPEITEINYTVKCESVDPVLHIVMKANGSKISFGEDAREEIPDETQCDDLGKCKTVIKSSIDFKSISRNRAGDEVGLLVEDRTNSKSALRNLIDLVIIQGRCKMSKNNEILDVACHDGNENGDADKSSSQQTQCQNTDTNTAGASYQRAPGNHGMSTLSGDNRDDDGDEENPGRTKRDERIGGCASSEVGETDKKQNANANNNRPQGDQAMPDQSLPFAECSVQVTQGAAGYERPQSPRSYSSLGPREYSYSSSENEDEILVVDANHCDGHMEVPNDDNVQPEVPVNREMEHFHLNPKDFFDQRIYQDDDPLRLLTYHDQAQGFVRKSDVDCRTGQKPSRPPDTRQEDGRQIPPGITLDQTPVQHAPWSHEPLGHLDPSSPPVLPHAPWSHEPSGHLDPSSPPVLPHPQLEGFLSQDGNEDEEQIPPSGISLGQTPAQHAPDSHGHPGSLDSPSSPVLPPHGQMDNPLQGSQANQGFVLQDGNAAEGTYPEQASRPDELRVDRTFQHPAENCRRVIRTCFSCNMPHIMSQDQNDSCNYCGRFFCLDHFDSHVCIVIFYKFLIFFCPMRPKLQKINADDL